MDTESLGAEETLNRLERCLGHAFRDRRLALQALTHSSAREQDLPCNERLEFLGDAVLGQVVSEYLYHQFPDLEEGDLSMMKSIIVSARTLAEAAREIGLDRILILGRGLAEKRGLPRSILCNVFEALVAALYLDGGMEAARRFILDRLRARVDEILKDEHEKNYKSMLQDYAQRRLSAVPLYRVVQETGPDHRKMFQVVVELGGRTYGPAWGSSKKEAEQSAARRALQEIGLLPPSGGEDPGPDRPQA